MVPAPAPQPQSLPLFPPTPSEGAAASPKGRRLQPQRAPPPAPAAPRKCKLSNNHAKRERLTASHRKGNNDQKASTGHSSGAPATRSAPPYTARAPLPPPRRCPLRAAAAARPAGAFPHACSAGVGESTSTACAPPPPMLYFAVSGRLYDNDNYALLALFAARGPLGWDDAPRRTPLTSAARKSGGTGARRCRSPTCGHKTIRSKT